MTRSPGRFSIPVETKNRFHRAPQNIKTRTPYRRSGFFFVSSCASSHLPEAPRYCRRHFAVSVEQRHSHRLGNAKEIRAIHEASPTRLQHAP